MKTSSKLLLGLCTLLLLALVGFNFSLRGEYQKINFNDAYQGYGLPDLKPFRAVRIDGRNAEWVSVSATGPSGIRIRKGYENKLSYRLQGDTLIITLPENSNEPYLENSDVISGLPIAYVQTPDLVHIALNGASAGLLNSKIDKLEVRLIGKSSALLLAKSEVKSLNTTLTATSLLKTAADLQVTDAVIRLQDTTTFWAEGDNFDNLEIQVSPTATLRLSGKLIQKAKINAGPVVQ